MLGDIKRISERLDDNSKHTTVLAPLNSAITQLPRKPWEDPSDYETLGSQAYDGSGGEDRAYRNLRRFVEAHIVPQNNWEEGRKVETAGGTTVWWENKGGRKLVRAFSHGFASDKGINHMWNMTNEPQLQPGDIEISSVIEKVSNGEIWVIKGCLNYNE